MDWLSSFRHVWLLDFEFQQPDGERPVPVCMVARDFKSGQLITTLAARVGIAAVLFR